MTDASPVTVRVNGVLVKPFRRGDPWRGDAGDVTVTAPTRAECVEQLAAAVRQAVESARERPAVVHCQDGTMLVCYVEPTGCGYDSYRPDGTRRGSCGMAGGMRDAVLAATSHARQSYGGEVAVSSTWKWEIERVLGARPAPSPEEAPTR